VRHAGTKNMNSFLSYHRFCVFQTILKSKISLPQFAKSNVGPSGACHIRDRSRKMVNDWSPESFFFKFWLHCCRIFKLIRLMTTRQTITKVLHFVTEMTFQSHTPYLTISSGGNNLRQLNIHLNIFLTVSPPLSTKLYIYYGNMIRAAEF
jgi:hypothetical protein